MKKNLKKVKDKLFKGLSDGLIFPLSHKWGINFDLREIRRNVLKEKWKYVLVTWSIMSIFVIGYLLYDRAQILAATYGFAQSDWSGGADTGSIALHDNDQDVYDKYYSKDNNISATSNQISLTNASTTITDTNTNEFENGFVGGGENHFAFDLSGNEMKLATPVMLDLSGYCGDKRLTVNNAPSWLTLSDARTYCGNLISGGRLPETSEWNCIFTSGEFGVPSCPSRGWFHSNTTNVLVNSANPNGSSISGSYLYDECVRCIVNE